MLRIVLTPVFVLCLMQGRLLWGVLIFTLAAVTDYYDGYFARKLNLTTAYGKFLDPFADKVLVLTTFMVFYMYDVIALWMVILVVSRDIIITVLRAYFMSQGKVLRTSVLGKYKTVSQFLLIYAVLGSVVFHSLNGVKDTAEIVKLLTGFVPFIILVHFVMAITVYSGLHYIRGLIHE